MADDPLAFSIDLEAVRDRLRFLKYFLTVEDTEAASFAMDQENAIPPAAYVSIAGETANPNRLIGGFAQQVNVVLSVVFAEGAADAARSSNDRMERTRKAVIRQMIAWTPPGAGDPLVYRSYALRSIGDGLMWGEVLFGTSYRLSI